MTDLLTRLEQATKGSRELSHGIAEAAGWCFVPAHTLSEAKWLPPDWDDPKTDPDFPEPPAFSTFLDAALTLVPEGWHKTIHIHRPEVGGGTEVRLHNNGPDFKGEAATPALALCIAALRARG